MDGFTCATCRKLVSDCKCQKASDKSICLRCHSAPAEFYINFESDQILCELCYEIQRPLSFVDIKLKEKEAWLAKELNLANMSPRQKKLVCQNFLLSRGLAKYLPSLAFREKDLICQYSGKHATNCSEIAQYQVVLKTLKLKPVYVCNKHSDSRYFNYPVEKHFEI